MKYVLVTGGVVSGLGKGVTASSIGVILKACGHRVTSIKIGRFVRRLNRKYGSIGMKQVWQCAKLSNAMQIPI